ncbi:MAG: TetR/AcrR family transcriptional regulator [Xanthomonadales bacterium]|nr:TetR/AcrR family transcriptional regulator [Xanthomonadales bacterium]
MTRRDTRGLILATSLELFNRLGEPNVSTNHIADEADISPGNLYYHFRSKDDIALELFKLFLVRMQPLLEFGEDGIPDAEEFWLRLHLVYETMGQFRFLYRNLADLHARIPKLRTAFHGLLERQRRALVFLLDGLSERGVMHLDYAGRTVLVDNMLLFMTFWIPYAEVQDHPGLEDGSVLASAVSRTLHLVIPHLRDAEAQLVSELAEQYLAA